MDTALLQRFAPVVYLDSEERIGPCMFEAYTDGSSLLDTEHGTKLAEPGAWSLADHADNKNVAMNYERAPPTPETAKDAPAYTVCSLVREGAKYYYSLLYILFWPVGQSLEGDKAKMGKQWPDVMHIRVYVDKDSNKIAKLYFPGYDNTGGWINPLQARYADTDRKRVQIFVGRGTHSLYPRRGTVWRVGNTKFNDRANGRGVEWSPVPAPLPAFLSAWTGDLGVGVPTPQQSPWFTKEEYKTGDDLLARTILS